MSVLDRKMIRAVARWLGGSVAREAVSFGSEGGRAQRKERERARERGKQEKNWGTQMHLGSPTSYT